MKNVVRKVSGAYKSCRLVTIDENVDRYKHNFIDSKTEDDVMKQGWVKKRGEYIRNWRPRYFILKSDGTLLGFEKKGDDVKMVNHFDVKGCQVESLEKPMEHSILIRFTGKSRLFCVETDDEKTSWLNAFNSIASKPCQESQPSTQTSSLEDIYEDSELGKVSFKDLEFLKILGVGTYGKVYLCKDKSTSNFYAVKKLRKDTIVENKQVEGTTRENRILQTTKHPFLVSLKNSCQTADNLFFILEFAIGGDLYFHLFKSRTFTEDQTRFYSGEIILAINYLHQSGIVYRDLKLENILVDRDGHIKITDFGLSKDGMTRDEKTYTHCGTAEYLAPEVIFCENGYTFSVDWWSLGVVMYEMLHGKLPFYNQSRQDMYRLILYAEVKFPGNVSEEAEDLLRGLIVKDPERRLGSGPKDGQEIMDHQFFAQIDWDKLLAREVQPPFVPELSSNSDLRYFEKQFTAKTVELASIDNGCTSGVHFYIGDDFESFEDFDCVNDDD